MELANLPGGTAPGADDPQSPRPGWARTLRHSGQSAWAAVGLAVLVAVALWLVWVVRVVVPPLLFAAVIVLLLSPLVVSLERRRIEEPAPGKAAANAPPGLARWRRARPPPPGKPALRAST